MIGLKHLQIIDKITFSIVTTQLDMDLLSESDSITYSSF